MVWYYQDGVGTWRVGGRAGRRMRRKLRRNGAKVLMWLEMKKNRISIQLRPLNPRKFCHLVRPRTYRQAASAGWGEYHITVALRRVRTYPALRAVKRIRDFFGGQAWRVTLPIAAINPASHVAWIPWNGHALSPIYGDLLYMRGQYGKHMGGWVGVSM